MPSTNTNATVTTVTDLIQSEQNIHHAIDELGALVGVERDLGEPAQDYRDRVWDVYVNKANASYGGLLYGANRELGLLSEPAISFSVASGVYLDSGPRIDIEQARIVLYSEWKVGRTPTVELTISIDAGKPNDWCDYHAHYMKDVVDIVNANSAIWEATIVDSSMQYRLAQELVPVTSVKLWKIQSLNSKHNKLEKDYIVPDSMIFNNPNLINESAYRGIDFDFSYEFVGPSAESDYWIDHDRGYVTLGLEYPSNIRCSYLYHDLPLVVKALPMKLYEFTDEYFQNTLYKVKQDSLDLEARSSLSPLAAGWINKLLLISNTTWGGDQFTNFPIAANDLNTDILDDLNQNDVSGETYISSVPNGFNYASARAGLASK